MWISEIDIYKNNTTKKNRSGNQSNICFQFDIINDLYKQKQSSKQELCIFINIH
jgi:hypothetical protein